MSETTPTPMPEGPYISIETRWGNKPGRPIMSDSNRETFGTGLTMDALKNQALERVQDKINEGETMVACHIHQNGSQGALLIGAWHYDAASHSEPVWAQGMVV